jgi:hypothetical protein
MHVLTRILIIVHVLVVGGALFGVPKIATIHRAAQLIVDGIRESEYGTGSYFGDTPATLRDQYISLKGGQVKTYEPSIFKRMRVSAGVSETEWLACMNPEQLESVSADSKSKQAFWRSKDGIVILKSIKHYECRNLLRVLEDLANHLDVPNDHSCITGVLGAFRVKLSNGNKVYFMACRNVYPAVQWHDCIRYDLKGSTIGRIKSPRSSVLKDGDLLRSGRRLGLGSMKPLVMNTLERDARFLSRCGFMDYSLLVNVELVPASFLRRLTTKIINPTTGAFRVK